MRDVVLLLISPAPAPRPEQGTADGEAAVREEISRIHQKDRLSTWRHFGLSRATRFLLVCLLANT